MRNKLRGIISIFIISIVFGCCNTKAQDTDLAEGFRDPGKEARPRAYWNWLNGDVSNSGLSRDLEEAKDKGLGGLLMWDTEAMRNPDGFVPAGLPAWYLGVAVLAWPHSEERVIPDLSEVVKPTGRFNDGELVWTPPAGEWHVQPAGLLGPVHLLPSLQVNHPGRIKC